MVRGLGLPARGVGVVWRMAGALALLAALFGGLLATPGMAAAATRSDGCATVDGIVDTTTNSITFIGYSFNAGEVITYTAAAQGGTPTVVLIKRDNVTVATAPYPGPATYTIPTTGVITALTFTQDTTGIPVTKTLTCTPPADPSAVTQVGGSATYGDATATLTATVTSGGQPVPAGGAVTFTFNGQTYPATTDAQGVATTTAPLPPGTAAGTYPGAVQASYAGTAGIAASSGSGPLVVARAATQLAQVRGTATYGDATATLTATLTMSGGAPVAGATVAFTLGGSPVGTATTNAQGVATLPAALPAGTNAGTYANRVCASYAGDTNHLATGPTCGPLVIGRAILWVKPVDRSVGLKQPNPPTDPHQDAACAAPSWCLDLARGSTFVNGQSWSALNLTNLRFQYARNPPSTNASEYVGKTYRITAFGVSSGNYDIRYDPGTMTVVPVVP